MRSRLCSLDSGSYVDTLSNLAFIDGLTVWSALEGIAEGALPSEILPVLFHEATHHWTFQSQVGTALSIAKISAARAMSEGKSAPSAVGPGDYAKYLVGGTSCGRGPKGSPSSLSSTWSQVRPDRGPSRRI